MTNPSSSALTPTIATSAPPRARRSTPPSSSSWPRIRRSPRRSKPPGPPRACPHLRVGCEKTSPAASRLGFAHHVRASLLRQKIDHHHIRKHRPEHLPQRLVFRMRQISIPILLAPKRHHEAVREPFVAVLRAHVRAPVEAQDSRDLVLQARERRLHRPDLLRRRLRLELERNDVVKRPFSLSRLALGGERQCERDSGEEGECLHGPKDMAVPRRCKTAAIWRKSPCIASWQLLRVSIECLAHRGCP